MFGTIHSALRVRKGSDNLGVSRTILRCCRTYLQEDWHRQAAGIRRHRPAETLIKATSPCWSCFHIKSIWEPVNWYYRKINIYEDRLSRNMVFYSILIQSESCAIPELRVTLEWQLCFVQWWLHILFRNTWWLYKSGEEMW